MLDKKRIRLMSRIAIYEKAGAKEDLKISSYYKKDYASFNSWITVLWMTVGYLIVIGLAALCNVEFILENLSISRMIPIVSFIVGGYLVLVIVYSVCAHLYYRSRHNRAKRRTREYYRKLIRLSRMDMEEKK